MDSGQKEKKSWKLELKEKFRQKLYIIDIFLAWKSEKKSTIKKKSFCLANPTTAPVVNIIAE